MLSLNYCLNICGHIKEEGTVFSQVSGFKHIHFAKPNNLQYIHHLSGKSPLQVMIAVTKISVDSQQILYGDDMQVIQSSLLI